jgi:hypothetical protein
MSDLPPQPDRPSDNNPSDPRNELSSIHSDNKAILVRMGDGLQFKAAITHTEKDGEHQVVVASAEVDLPLLRLCAEPMMKMLEKKFGVRMESLRYFEHGHDGALTHVEPPPVGDNTVLHRSEADPTAVLERQHPARLPQVEPDIDLSQESFPQTPEFREQARQEFRKARFHRYRL